MMIQIFSSKSRLVKTIEKVSLSEFHFADFVIIRSCVKLCWLNFDSLLFQGYKLGPNSLVVEFFVVNNWNRAEIAVGMF